jgi:hypothetical protein
LASEYNKEVPFAPIYIIQNFFRRIFDFLIHWYRDGLRKILRVFIGTLEKLDESLAIRVTVVHFFEPLYKDYSLIGRILGIIFRSARIVVGAIVYFFVGLFFLLVATLWAIFLPFIIFQAFS